MTFDFILQKGQICYRRKVLLPAKGVESRLPQAYVSCERYMTIQPLVITGRKNIDGKKNKNKKKQQYIQLKDGFFIKYYRQICGRIRHGIFSKIKTLYYQ